MTAASNPVQAFNEAELANLLLCMCLESWQDKYALTQDSLPQSVRKLLGILENIEKVVANSNTKDKAMKESTEKATRKGKHKGTNSNEFWIPKKAKVEKSYALCRVPKVREGSLKKGFSKKAAIGQKCHGNGKKDHANSFVQIMEHFLKLKKAVKKTQKSLRKMKCHQEYSDSSDSDSE